MKSTLLLGLFIFSLAAAIHCSTAADPTHHTTTLRECILPCPPASSSTTTSICSTEDANKTLDYFFASISAPLAEALKPLLLTLHSSVLSGTRKHLNYAKPIIVFAGGRGVGKSRLAMVAASLLTTSDKIKKKNDIRVSILDDLEKKKKTDLSVLDHYDVILGTLNLAQNETHQCDADGDQVRPLTAQETRRLARRSINPLLLERTQIIPVSPFDEDAYRRALRYTFQTMPCWSGVLTESGKPLTEKFSWSDKEQQDALDEVLRRAGLKDGGDGETEEDDEENGYLVKKVFVHALQNTINNKNNADL